MSQKEAREGRRQVAAPAQRPAPFRANGKGAVATLVVVAAIVASFAIPKLTGGSSSATHAGMAAMGAGPALGSAPQFDKRDVITGKTISSQTLRGHRTLLFFSEGVMCQACLQQIRDIDDVGQVMAKRHIQLVSITPDSPSELRQAIDQYGIRSPMISDTNRSMSSAFNELGRGMHADTPGHAFVLLDARGRVVWQRDYYQPPYDAMYVKPARLFKDVPA